MSFVLYCMGWYVSSLTLHTPVWQLESSEETSQKAVHDKGEAMEAASVKHTHARIYTYTRARMQAYIHTHIHMCTHAGICIHANMHIHTCTHMYTAQTSVHDKGEAIESASVSRV